MPHFLTLRLLANPINSGAARGRQGVSGKHGAPWSDRRPGHTLDARKGALRSSTRLPDRGAGAEAGRRSGRGRHHGTEHLVTATGIEGHPA